MIFGSIGFFNIFSTICCIVLCYEIKIKRQYNPYKLVVQIIKTNKSNYLSINMGQTIKIELEYKIPICFLQSKTTGKPINGLYAFQKCY